MYRKYYNNFYHACKQIEKKAEYRNYPMALSILSDFYDEDLETMMDLGVKYTGLGSFAIPDPLTHSDYSRVFAPRDLCSGFEVNSTSNSVPSSWASAVIIAAEAALHDANHNNVALSLAYLYECLPKISEVAVSDVSPAEIIDFITDNGLMSEQTYNMLKLSEQDVCSADAPKFYFDVTKNDIPNKSGLMNFVAEGDPVIVLMALDLVRLKTVNDVTGDAIYTGAADEPSVYGVMKGFDEKKWTVTFNVVPCENIELNLPVVDNDTNANYAGLDMLSLSASSPHQRRNSRLKLLLP